MSYIFFISVIAVVIMVLAVASFTSFELDDYHYDRLKWITMRWSYIVTFIALIVKTFDISYGIETVTIVAGKAYPVGTIGRTDLNSETGIADLTAEIMHIVNDEVQLKF